MNAYSEDLRKKIIQALRRGMGKSEAARTFSVSLPSVKCYAKMADEGRSLAPKKRPDSRSKTSEEAKQLLETDLEARPAATFSERRRFLQRVCTVKVRELIEGRGCELLFLPPYSPDYNPIEEAFPKIKAQTRTREALGAAISAVAAEDAAGFFEHCGYCRVG